jgi:hypothetical protein
MEGHELPVPRIEQFGNTAWAVITAAGVAVYTDPGDAVGALRERRVEETAEDWEWYEEHSPWHFCPELTAAAKS